MKNHTLDLADIHQAFRQRAAVKGWQAYHTPKNLAAAVAVEAAELLEIFQWLTDEQAQQVKDDAEAKNRVADQSSRATSKCMPSSRVKWPPQ